MKTALILGLAGAASAVSSPLQTEDNMGWLDRDGESCWAYRHHPNGAHYACTYPGYEAALVHCARTCGPYRSSVGAVGGWVSPPIRPPTWAGSSRSWVRGSRVPGWRVGNTLPSGSFPRWGEGAGLRDTIGDLARTVGIANILEKRRNKRRQRRAQDDAVQLPELKLVGSNYEEHMLAEPELQVTFDQ